MFRVEPLGGLAQILRGLRDPRDLGFEVDLDTPAGTRGVIPADRSRHFNTHPDGGEWSKARRHFDERATITQSKNDTFSAFVDYERDGEGEDDSRAVDFLPSIVRSDCP